MAEPAFSPDGEYLYYSQDTTPGRVWQYNKDSTGQIFTIQRLERATGEIETFVSGPGGAIRPVPSPDGRHLAFVKRIPGLQSALYLKDLESGKEWAIYRELERDLQETNGSQGNFTSFDWTPDSQSIVFWAGGKIRRIDVESREHTVIPVRVRAAKKVAPALRFPVEVAPEEFDVRMLRWAQLSPDGETALFQALGHLYVKDLESGRQRRLTSQDEHFEFHPAYSRDGRWIVYTTWDDQELGSVRIVSARGGESRVVTQAPGHYVEPQFSARRQSHRLPQADRRLPALRRSGRSSRGSITSRSTVARPSASPSPVSGRTSAMTQSGFSSRTTLATTAPSWCSRVST